MTKQNLTKIVKLEADMSYQDDEDAAQAVFDVIKNAGLKPEQLVYRVIDGDYESVLDENSITPVRDFIYAYSFEEVKIGDGFPVNLPDLAKAYEKPILCLYLEDKLINGNVHPDQDFVSSAILEEDEIGDPSYAYFLKEGNFKSAYVGKIELTTEQS